MVNHLRTLLLNDVPNPGAMNEQYIPKIFVPRVLNYAASAVQNLLIQPNWPRDYRNFVATVLTGVALDSPLAYLVNNLDARTTLNFSENYVSSFREQITLNRQANAPSLNIVGIYNSNAPLGIFNGQWQITQVNSTTVAVLDFRTGLARNVAITFNGDVSPLYPLEPLNALNFQFVGVAAVPAIRAVVTAVNPMCYSVLSALERLRNSSEAQAVFEFVTDPSVAQILTETFQTSTRPDHALAAILIAYACALTPST